MKIAIPTNGDKGLNELVADHFGRCLTYTFLDENGKLLEIIKNTNEHTGDKELPPMLIKKHGADILLCKDLGLKALDLCQQLKISVFIGQAKTVMQIFKLWKNNKIKKADEQGVCHQHT